MNKSLLQLLQLICVIYTMVSTLRIACWNLNCNADIADDYLRELASDADIIAISEHGYFPCELYKMNCKIPGYKSFAKASAQLKDIDMGHRRGIGGCAILWNASILDYKVKPIEHLGSDRMAVLELNTENMIMFIISVYLPQQRCQISNYDNELDILQSVLDECGPKGPCIILGDTNAHFSQMYGSRGWGNSNLNAPKLHKLALQNDMTIADLGESGYGPCHTYSGWHGHSYLDHCIVSNSIMSDILSCSVVNDSVLNVSDHLAMLVNISIILKCHENNMDKRRQVAWHKMSDLEIEESYTVPLEQLCVETLHVYGYSMEVIENFQTDPRINPRTLDSIIKDLSDNINKTSRKLLNKKFDKNLKPYWNDNLKQLSKDKKRSRNEWVNAGRPRKNESDAFKNYKERKREFRRMKRRHVYEYEKEQMKQFSMSQDIDQRYFWYVVNKHRKKNIVSPIRTDDGVVLTEPGSIRNEWTQYYSDLYTESGNEDYDDAFKNEVERDIITLEEMMENNEYLNGGPISPGEIKSIIMKMKLRKAPGWDDITVEHIRNAGHVVIKILTWVINGLVHFSHIPQHFKQGLLVPIPKPNKDSYVKDNNRGITLVPVLYKLFEKIMMNREEGWFQSNAVNDEIQSSGKNGISCLHSSLLVQETIAYNRNNGNSVYAAFLDTKKAFDTLWIEGMLHKLLKSGVNSKLYWLIKSAYTDYKCAVLIAGEYGNWFYPKRGVHQGAPMSMHLYILFINDLLISLKKSGHGISINGHITTVPTHADDLALLALFKSSLNVLLSMAYNYSLKWRYSFNTDKTVYMMWGNDHQPSVDTKFGVDSLSSSNICKHMGVKLCNDGNMLKGMYEERAGATKCVVYAARGLGSGNNPVSTKAMSKIYFSVALPKMTYGLEVTPVSESCLLTLEDAHRVNAKLIQGLPKNTHRPVPLATVGWVSIQAHVALLKIMFLLRILCLPINSLYRKIVVSRIEMLSNDSVNVKEKMIGPIKDALYYVSRYRLNDIITKYLNNAVDNNLKSTKRYIKEIIDKAEYQRWRASCMLYPELKIYLRGVSNIKMHVWWSLVQVHPHTFKKISAVMSVLMGNEPKGLQCFRVHNLCGLCSLRETDSSEHILFRCEALAELRNTKLNELYSIMPSGMISSIYEMSDAERLVLLLSGLHCTTLVEEWIPIMTGISSFVYTLYEMRMKLYDREKLNINPIQ